MDARHNQVQDEYIRLDPMCARVSVSISVIAKTGPSVLKELIADEHYLTVIGQSLLSLCQCCCAFFK